MESPCSQLLADTCILNITCQLIKWELNKVFIFASKVSTSDIRGYFILPYTHLIMELIGPRLYQIVNILYMVVLKDITLRNLRLY